jgi:hypothetical protein
MKSGEGYGVVRIPNRPKPDQRLLRRGFALANSRAGAQRPAWLDGQVSRASTSASQACESMLLSLAVYVARRYAERARFSQYWW